MPLSSIWQKHLNQCVLRRLEECDAVLVTDHAKGACRNELLAEVFKEANRLRLLILWTGLLEGFRMLRAWQMHHRQQSGGDGLLRWLPRLQGRHGGRL
jgi:hypothetical protein